MSVRYTDVPTVASYASLTSAIISMQGDQPHHPAILA